MLVYDEPYRGIIALNKTTNCSLGGRTKKSRPLQFEALCSPYVRVKRAGWNRKKGGRSFQDPGFILTGGVSLLARDAFNGLGVLCDLGLLLVKVLCDSIAVCLCLISFAATVPNFRLIMVGEE